MVLVPKVILKKNIRENVKKKLVFITHWTDYKIKLGSTKFINLNDQYTFKNAVCIKGYITTISSLQEIWSYLQSKNIECLNLRRLNMDALEDLFTKIRQYGPPFNNLTCYQFISGLKSTLITHLSSPLGQINWQDKGYKTDRLTEVETWMKLWRIKANESKSVHVTFTLRRETCPPVTLNCKFIPQENNAKYLGMHLERRFTWQKHIWT